MKKFFADLSITTDSSWTQNLVPSFKEIKTNISSGLTKFANWIKSAIGKLNLASVGDKFNENMLESFSGGLQTFFTRITGLLSTGLLAALVLSITNFLKNWYQRVNWYN